jgi:beta-glucosidase-like glycosyl hydrolase
MGKNYIQGVHEGSTNRVAVIAKHFPGRGSSDRMPDQEVATVRKSLEQLKQIELAPFFAVTGSASGDPSRTDGLLVSHIRYQGFQGNIRVSTRPVSFDSTALEQLMQLEPISGWRTNGGIVVSDDLGSQAVRKFYDPLEQTFDANVRVTCSSNPSERVFPANHCVAQTTCYSMASVVSQHTPTLAAWSGFQLAQFHVAGEAKPSRYKHVSWIGFASC